MGAMGAGAVSGVATAASARLSQSAKRSDLNVYSASLVGGQLQILTIPTLLTNWTTTPSLVSKFLLLRRYNDEQNIILTYNKPAGQTSYGFLIPNTVSPDVTNNINTLQAAVQSQLLSTQVGTSNI
jgi:hypothetical protein